MAFKLRDFVKETASVTGTGDISLGGAVSTYGAFNGFLSNTDTTMYSIALNGEWETGIGTYNSGANSITRTKVLSSSNADALVSFTAGGTKVIICGEAAAACALGKQGISVPASGMQAALTNGPQGGIVATATNANLLTTLNFDGTTAESAYFAIMMPPSWDEGTITFQPAFSQLTTAAGAVVFELAAVACSDGDSIDVTYGTGQTSAKTAGTLNTLYVGPESAAITVAGTPQAGDFVFFRIKRLPADAGDTLAQDARLHSIRLYVTVDAGHD